MTPAAHAAAIGRARAVAAALAAPAAALRHAVVAAERLVDLEPVLAVLDVDPFTAVGRGTEVAAPDGRPPPGRRAAGRPRAGTPTVPTPAAVAAPSAPSRPHATTLPNRLRVASSVAPTAPPGTAPGSGPSPPPDVQGPTPGDAPRREETPRPVRGDGEEAFGLLATRRIAALLAAPADVPTSARGDRAAERAPSHGRDGPAPASTSRAAAPPAPPSPPVAPAHRDGHASAGRSNDAASSSAHATRPATSGSDPAGPPVNGASALTARPDAPTPPTTAGFALQRGGRPSPSVLPTPLTSDGHGARGDGHLGASDPPAPAGLRPAPLGGRRPADDLDAEELAAVVNEVLADQARRHGVDLT